MHRREVIKGIAAAGAMAVAPKFVMANNNALPIHFIGLGGAGCNTIETIYDKKKDHHFTCINTLQRKHWPNTFQFIPIPPPVVTGFAATNALVCNSFPIMLTSEIKSVFAQSHQYVLLAGLGGYTGTRLMQALTTYLNEENHTFTAVASLPFKWETNRQKAVAELLPSLQVFPQFHHFDLNALAAEADNKTMNLKLFFQKANERLYDLFVSSKKSG